MTELNKNSFYFYLLKKCAGKIDPRSINFIIDTLKEWLPDDVGCPESGYSSDAYEYGQREYKDFLMMNLK
jgi:hypothetical protein